MKSFSYKDGCGMYGRHMRIETFKEAELAWATDEQLQIIKYNAI